MGNPVMDHQVAVEYHRVEALAVMVDPLTEVVVEVMVITLMLAAVLLIPLKDFNQ